MIIFCYISQELFYQLQGLRNDSLSWHTYIHSGVDPSVKVVYKPVSRYREESGLISKTVVYKYKQVTEILNTRTEPAVVTFTDQVPRSEDEKLKVRVYYNLYT